MLEIALEELAFTLDKQPAEHVPMLFMHATFLYELNEIESRALYKRLRGASKRSEVLDKTLTESWLAHYEDCRSIGMTAVEAGQFLGLYEFQMNDILRGKALYSYDLYRNLCDIELRAPMNLKYKALKAIDAHLEAKNYTAALAVLERIIGGPWKPKAQEMAIVNTLKVSAEDCENMAKRAKERLKELRAARERNDD